VIELVDSSGLPLEGSAGSASLDPTRLLFLLRQVPVPEEAVVVDLEVAVEGDVSAVACQRQRIDLRNGRVVVEEDVGQRREDGTGGEEALPQGCRRPRYDLRARYSGSRPRDKNGSPSPPFSGSTRGERSSMSMPPLPGEDRHRILASES
jgi:hypothetical protein